ncbi:MAG: hypothetical protein KKC20_24920 [Proteobacteria bacterium]|nr:hypothetical protein [Pseudomonadota bacterium]
MTDFPTTNKPGRPGSLTPEDVLLPFQYQAICTFAQIRQVLNFSAGKPHSDTTLRKYLDKLTLPMTEYDNANLLWKVDGPIRGWAKVDKQNAGGRNEKVYGLSAEGAKLLEKLGHKREGSFTSFERITVLHALALTDIGIACLQKGKYCEIDRQVLISTDETKLDPEGNPRTKEQVFRPDVKFWDSRDTTKTIQFMEFEQERITSALPNKINTRMSKWEDFFTRPESANFSKDVLVLFWIDGSPTQEISDNQDNEKTQDNLTTEENKAIQIWMKALSDLEIFIGHELSFTVYWKRFADFYANPTFDINRYEQIFASANPEHTLTEKRREKFFQLQAETILTPLDQKLSSKQTLAYINKEKSLAESLQNASNRQEFFFTEMENLFTISLSQKDRKGYSLSSIPWLDIYLVRFWIEQEQLTSLRRDLVVAINDIYAAARNQPSAATAYENMVWDVLFRFFNFSSGGPLRFKVSTSAQDSQDRAFDLFPRTTIVGDWPGVVDQSKADRLSSAIDWFITTLVRYKNELGLDNPKNKRKRT